MQRMSLRSIRSGRQGRDAMSSGKDVTIISPYTQFLRDNWCSLNESERLELLQEVANQQIQDFGGSYSVDVSFENMKSNVSGYQFGNQIRLNRDMFVNDKLVETYNGRKFEFPLNDSNWQALETVLHEGRHVYQDKIVEGIMPADIQLKEAFSANGFSVVNIDGQRASQYLQGESNYALYYLNPTELDAYQMSQQKTQEVIAKIGALSSVDKSAESYMQKLQITGYEAQLEKFKTEYSSKTIDKDVENVLKNTYYGRNNPVDKRIETTVKNEMIKSQEILDNAKGKELNNMSKQEYTENGFTYTIDDSGTITAQGQVPTQGVKCGSRVTPDGMQPGDQRGHIIAAQEGGPNKSYNMTAQDGKLNQGAYKTVENTEVDLARQGCDVQTSKTAYVSTQEGGRPDAYMINDTITSQDGKTQNVNLSFQNMSPEEQETQNIIINEMNIDEGFDNPDPLRDSMSNEEYNTLMEETESDLPSIRDEFDTNNITEMSFVQECMDEANSSYESESTSTSSGTAFGMDGGSDGGMGADVGGGVEM